LRTQTHRGVRRYQGPLVTTCLFPRPGPWKTAFLFRGAVGHPKASGGVRGKSTVVASRPSIPAPASSMKTPRFNAPSCRRVRSSRQKGGDAAEGLVQPPDGPPPAARKGWSRFWAPEIRPCKNLKTPARELDGRSTPPHRLRQQTLIPEDAGLIGTHRASAVVLPVVFVRRRILQGPFVMERLSVSPGSVCSPGRRYRPAPGIAPRRGPRHRRGLYGGPTITPARKNAEGHEAPPAPPTTTAEALDGAVLPPTPPTLVLPRYRPAAASSGAARL